MAAIKRTSADKWFSLAIRTRDGFRCQHCGKQFNGPERGCEAAHIVGRREKILRWDADNAVTLCTHCHFVFTGEPVAFVRWLEQYLGSGHLELLQERRRGILKATKAVRDEIAAHYRTQVRMMQDDPCHTLISWE